MTFDLLTELWIAREILSVKPEERERTTSGAFAPMVKTWADYCKAIGIDKSTANRWIAREILSVPPQEAAKKHDANAPRFTWADYCKAIGIDKSTANRWIAREMLSAQGKRTDLGTNVPKLTWAN